MDSDETYFLSTKDKEYALKLARKIYNESLEEALDINEITQTAISALCNAVKNYEPNTNLSLQAYAYPRVRHALEEQLVETKKPLVKKIVKENLISVKEQSSNNESLINKRKLLHKKLSTFLS